MAQAGIAAAVIKGILPGLTGLTISWTDKVGFDMDIIGRERRITEIEEVTRAAYDARNTKVNIAVWNMYLKETHSFNGITESGTIPEGKGGGFRLVVFTGSGQWENRSARGFDNWRGSGYNDSQWQESNAIYFRAA